MKTQQHAPADSSSSGLTLIELLVTLFVMGVLAAVIIPVAENVLAKMEARATVLELEADIALAQKHTMATENSVKLEGYRSNGYYRIVEIRPGSQRTMKSVTLPPSMSFTDNPEIYFRSNTTFPGQSNGGTISIKRGNDFYADIVVTVFTNKTRVEWHD